MTEYFENDFKLADAMAGYIGEALRNNQGFLIIATKENSDQFLKLLEESGHDVNGSSQSGQLVLMDVKVILDRLLIHHSLDTETLHSLLWEKITLMKKKFPKVIAYGEMVNILWKENNLHGMITVDRLWKKISCDLDFSLISAYSMQHLKDEKYGITFHEIIQK